MHSLAGPLQRSRSVRAAGRDVRISSSPRSGARGPQQHGHALVLVAAHRVRAPVHAVGEVHVQAARWTEHRRVARGAAAEGMAPGVLGAAVRLDLDDATGPAVADEHLAEQLGRDLRGSRR